MEENNIIKQNIIKYILKNYDINENMITISIENLEGITNQNFLVTVNNKSLNKILCKIFYRNYGKIYDIVDHNLEILIMKELAIKGIGPKIYEVDINKKYRLDEYLDNTSTLTSEDEFNPKILDQIINIIENYSSISNIYKYIIKDENISFNVIDNKNSKYKEINNNIFTKCMNNMFKIAEKKVKIFSEDYKNTYSKEDKIDGYNNLDKFVYYIKNFKKIFLKFFPSEGFFVLSHNDIHKLNILKRKDDNKLFLLDNEYAFFNLPGFDISNYLNESAFLYDNGYSFAKEKIDFDKYFEIYKIYIKKFIENHKFLNDSKFGKDFLNLIQTKKYYVQLHQISNLFWLLYCGIYLNFNNVKNNPNEYYYLHFIHRFQYVEIGEKFLSKYKLI